MTADIHSINRRQFLLTTGAGALSAALPLTGEAAKSVVPALKRRNAYQQANLAASNGRYVATFIFEGMVDAWGIAIRPAGAGGHFWVTAGATSYQFVGDIATSSNPNLRTLFQDGLSEVYIPCADALTTADSIGKVTGTAYNGALITSDLFRVRQQTATINNQSVLFDGSARFIFVMDSGTISAWTDRAANGSTVRVNGASQLMFDGCGKAWRFSGLPLKQIPVMCYGLLIFGLIRKSASSIKPGHWSQPEDLSIPLPPAIYATEPIPTRVIKRVLVIRCHSIFIFSMAACL